jgi:RNA polymerase sigma-70 factor, ECF subfamily
VADDLDPAWRERIAAALAELGPPGATAAVEPAATTDALHAHAAAAIARGATLAHADELVLAWALGRGHPEAVRRFDRDLVSELDAAARKIDRTPSFVDEVRQLARIRLLVGDQTAPPRITTYGARGPLRGWLAVATLRIALNLKRDARRTAPHDVLADVIDREPDPELRHLRTLYRAELRDALEAALHALPDRARAILRLRFVDGLELAQIGRLYDVHESTASRWVSAAVETVSSDARRRLINKLALSASSLDSVARLVASHLDLSISRLLQE